MASKSRNRRSARRFVQFSLRSVLVLITLLAVTLALWKVYLEPYRIQREAAAAIVAADGTVRTEPDQPEWILAMFGAENFQNVVEVESPPETTLSCGDLLPRLTALRKATIDGAAFTDEHLRAMPQRRPCELVLRGTTVTQEQAAKLEQQRPNLTITVGPLDVPFDDLRFEPASYSWKRSKPFDRSELTRRILGLDGSTIRIRAYILPTFTQFGLTNFVLERDNMYSWRIPRLDDVIVTMMKAGHSVDYSARLLVMEGKFFIEEFRDPTSGKVRGVFRMSDATLHKPPF